MTRPTDKYNSIELIEKGADILNNHRGTEKAEGNGHMYTKDGHVWKCTNIDIYSDYVEFHYLYPGTTVIRTSQLYYKDIDKAIRNIKINNLVNEG